MSRAENNSIRQKELFDLIDKWTGLFFMSDKANTVGNVPLLQYANPQDYSNETLIHSIRQILDT